MRKQLVSLLIAMWLVIAVIFAAYFLYPPTPAAIRPHEPIEIQSDAEFTEENGVVSGDGTEDSPYVIEGWEIRANAYGGIWIFNTDAHFAIRNVIIEGSGDDNHTNGITLDRVSNGEIVNCVIWGNRMGIIVAGSSGIRIFGNTVFNSSDEGIGISEGSSDVVVERNTVWSEVESWSGIDVALGAHDVTIANNVISHIRNDLNLGKGISTFNSSDIKISANQLFDCDYGIMLYLTSDTIVYHNTLSENSRQASDIFSPGNEWNLGDYPGGWGNYWSDYDGSDLDGDGIGDTPYEISAGIEDMYPLMAPYE